MTWTELPFSRYNSPATVVRPVSALLVARVAASAIRALERIELDRAIDRADLAAGEFQQRIVIEADRTGLHRHGAEPGRSVVMSNVDWTVPLPAMWIAPVLLSAFAVTVSPVLMLA